MTADLASKNSVAPLDQYTSNDPMMLRCLELARIACRTDIPVLLLGESGTGKTLLSQAIHLSSLRKDKAFVSFNAAALSDTLLDSQLFGHEKGAFTSADRRVRGKFEQADGGTLFIDEIADMSSHAQAKILRAVEYGEFERLGSEDVLQADVRLITATHLPLREFITHNKFRKDLFYRLSGITITIPPLRSRRNDLPGLIAAEIERIAVHENKVITGLTREARDLLLAYSWPGNLRELNRVLHTAVVISDDEVVKREHLLVDIGLESEGSDSAGLMDGDLRLKSAEIRHISRVLQLMNGNKRKSAEALDISRSTLDRKLAEMEN